MNSTSKQVPNSERFVAIVRQWTNTIVSSDDSLRNRTLDSLAEGLDADGLLAVAQGLDQFHRESSNLYHRVRAHFMLAAIYRYLLPGAIPETNAGLLPYEAYQHILGRRFSEAIDTLIGVLYIIICRIVNFFQKLKRPEAKHNIASKM